MQALEEHHISYKPEVKVVISRKEHQKIHHNEVNDSPLSRLVRRYENVTIELVRLKNWMKSYEKEFGVVPSGISIKQFQKLKWCLSSEIYKMVKIQSKKVKHIKGLGKVSLAGMLVYGHPEMFSSRWKFLCHCGFTETSKVTQKYSRRAKYHTLRAVTQTMRYKDKKYYMLYKKFRGQGRMHRQAMIRVGTFLLKEFYEIFKNKG